MGRVVLSALLLTAAISATATDAAEPQPLAKQLTEQTSEQGREHKKELATLRAQLDGRRRGTPTPMAASMRPQGRRLSDSSKGLWQQSVHHVFEDPSSCALHADLNDPSTGPLDIRRQQSGQLSVGYGSSVAFSVDAPFAMRHPAGCGSATVDFAHPVLVNGAAVSTEAQLDQLRAQAGLGFERGAGFATNDVSTYWGWSAIRAYGQDKYLGPHNGDDTFQVASSAGDWEKLRITRLQGARPQYAIWTFLNELVAATSGTTVVHSGTIIGEWQTSNDDWASSKWEIFEPITNSNGEPWGWFMEQNFASYNGGNYTGGAVAIYNPYHRCYLYYDQSGDYWACSSDLLIWQALELIEVPGAQQISYSSGGRRLSDSSKGLWQQSVHHVFEDPSSCALHADLNDPSTGPLEIRRQQSGQLSVGYGSSAAFSVDAPFAMRHPAGCGSATVDFAHPVLVNGAAVSTEAQLDQLRAQAGLGFERGAGFNTNDVSTYWGWYAIRAYGQDKYLSAHDTTTSLEAHTVVGDWEKLRITRLQGARPQYAIWTWHNSVLQANSGTTVVHSGTYIGNWETWDIYEPTTNRIGEPWGWFMEQNFASYNGGNYTGGAVAIYNPDQQCYLYYDQSGDYWACSSDLHGWQALELIEVPGAQQISYSSGGRRLSDSSKGLWQQSVHHVFEDPSSCALHADLNDPSTGPLEIRRQQSGQLSVGYGSSVAFSVDAPFAMRHPAGCGNATVDFAHPVLVNGAAVSTEAQLDLPRAQAGLGFERGAGFNSNDVSTNWGWYAIRAYGQDKYLMASNDGTFSPQNAVGDWEKLRITRLRGWRWGYAIWTWHNSLVAATSGTNVVHSGTNMGDWETWDIYDPTTNNNGEPWGWFMEQNFASYNGGTYTGGAVAIYNPFHKCYLYYDQSGDYWACSSDLHSWQALELIEVPGAEQISYSP